MGERAALPPRPEATPPVTIHGFVQEHGKLLLLVQFGSDSKFYSVSRTELQRKYPLELIKFYEQHIRFE
jgi:hypothetical protein